MRKTRSNDLPPNVWIEPTPPALDAYGWINGRITNVKPNTRAPWVLVEKVAHSPSFFILGWYATPEDAARDAWDCVSKHDARLPLIARQAERTNARLARQRLAQRRREERQERKASRKDGKAHE